MRVTNVPITEKLISFLNASGHTVPKRVSFPTSAPGPWIVYKGVKLHAQEKGESLVAVAV